MKIAREQKRFLPPETQKSRSIQLFKSGKLFKTTTTTTTAATTTARKH